MRRFRVIRGMIRKNKNKQHYNTIKGKALLIWDHLRFCQGSIHLILPSYHILGSESNFYKYSHHVIDSLGIPYDYSSIMHYGKRELAWPPWKVTIEPKQSGVKIGQRRHLSTLDRKQMNMLYKCNKK